MALKQYITILPSCWLNMHTDTETEVYVLMDTRINVTLQTDEITPC